MVWSRMEYTPQSLRYRLKWPQEDLIIPSMIWSSSAASRAAAKNTPKTSTQNQLLTLVLSHPSMLIDQPSSSIS
jgi:hypothetical protein